MRNITINAIACFVQDKEFKNGSSMDRNGYIKLMTAKFHNNLRFYTLRLNESSEQAEVMALKFEEKFNDLDKYDQLDMSFQIEMDGWDTAFERLGMI